MSDTYEAVGLNEGEEETLLELEGISQSDPDSADAESEEFAYKIIKRAASLSGVKIDRAAFIRTELRKHCPHVDVDLAVATTPIEAGVTVSEVDEIARSAVDFETKKCAGLSFLAGIPGGIALVGTVPADLAQYFAHVMRIEQKLAYLYGWQTFLNDADEVDDETIMQLVVLMGVMMQVGGAANSITKFAANAAQAGVAKTIQRQALAKTTFYPVMKSVLRVLGIQLTKETFAKTVSKAVPIVGGAVSGGLTYATFKPGAEHLRKYLRSLPVSGIDQSVPEEEPEKAFDEAFSAVSSRSKDLASCAAEQTKLVGAAAVEQVQSVGVFVADGAKSAGNAIAEGAQAAGVFLDSLKRKKSKE